MTVKALQNFFKRRDKLISDGLITEEQYNETRDSYKKNQKDERLRPHKISCKKGENLISLTVIPETQVRIMVNVKDCDPKIAIFTWIGKHREYERIIGDKKNCKSLFVKCDEAKYLQCE